MSKATTAYNLLQHIETLKNEGKLTDLEYSELMKINLEVFNFFMLFKIVMIITINFWWI